jgi:hypothetical protein
VVGVRKFRRDVYLRAAAIIWPPGSFPNPIEVRFQLSARISRVKIRYAVPDAPKILVFGLQECGDEIILCAEVAIEARFGDPGRFNHEVNANGSYSPLIEERRRRLENSVPHIF